jgi:mono/diheme cytochrome c family protein
MKTKLTVVLVLVALAAAAYSGAYNIAADEPHWGVTERALAFLRERSIEMRSRELPVPDLTNEKRVVAGAGQYAEMCETCHLAPGVQDTELRRGLYPKPPELARVRRDARQAFWIVKHGIKASGMPAWGPTHDDATLWNVVAFLQKLPDLDEKAYRELVGRSAPHEATPAGAASDQRRDSPHMHRH